MIELSAALAGWPLFFGAAAAAVVLRRRLGLVADAEHELRGPLTALALGLDGLRAEPGARPRAEALAAELGRMRVAVADLAAARRGSRARARPEPAGLERLVRESAEAWSPVAAASDARMALDWRAGDVEAVADPARLAQAFGNLLANAVEHGGDEIELSGRRAGGGVRIELRDGGRAPSAWERARGSGRGRTGAAAPGTDRGRGLAIAERAVREAGGTLELSTDPGGGVVAVVELPTRDPR